MSGLAGLSVFLTLADLAMGMEGPVWLGLAGPAWQSPVSDREGGPDPDSVTAVCLSLLPQP